MSVNGKYQWFQFRRLLRGITNLTLFLILWLIWPRSLDSVSDMAQKTFSVPDYQMQSLRYVSVKNGHNEIELHAQHGAFLLEIQELRLRTIQANVFGEDQSVTKILSDRGSYRMRSRDLYLQDQIEVEASDGFKIFTDQAQYSLPTKIMKVPQALRGASADGGIKVAADRAEAPIFSKTIKLFGNATGSFVEKKHGLTTVSADQAEMHRGTDDIKFESNVKLVQSKVEMTSKRATLNYAKVKKPSVQYLVARDDVVIKEKSGRFTRSQVAEFFATNDTIVLTGFPSVYDGEDAVTGDRITLYRSTGVVEATAANAAVGSPNMRPSQKNGDDDDNELAL